MEGVKNILFSSINFSSAKDDYKVLFDELYDRLVYFSVQITKDKIEAEDIVQECFIHLWDHMDKLVAHRDVYKQYLYKAVKNQSLNYLRHQHVVDKYHSYSKIFYEESEESILEHMMTAEVFAELNNAIAELPTHYKQVSELSFHQGKKNQEIADELGMSVNTLKKQKQKIVQLLRVKLTSILMSFIF